jgi:hypothetical protein
MRLRDRSPGRRQKGQPSIRRTRRPSPWSMQREVFIEVAGAEELCTEFERLFCDKHLAPDEIRGLWESNEPARAAIERVFGAAALLPAFERLLLAEPAAGPGPRIETVPNGADPPTSRTAPARVGKRVAGKPTSDHRLHVDPGWGDQKVFRHYRAALHDLHNQGSAKPVEIARFREANAALEARLRLKLPQRMAEIDAIFDHIPSSK